MATPTEIIENVLLEIERPDLRTQAENKFAAVVNEVHSIRKFKQDVVTYDLAEFTVTANQVNLNTFQELPNFRECLKIICWGVANLQVDDSYIFSHQLLVGTEFIDRSLLITNTDYYGFAYQHTYSRIGTAFQIRGVPSECAGMQILGLAFPTVQRNEITMELETSSFIVEQMPEVIEAYLARKLVTASTDVKRINVLEDAKRTARMSLLNVFAGDVINGV